MRNNIYIHNEKKYIKLLQKVKVFLVNNNYIQPEDLKKRNNAALIELFAKIQYNEIPTNPYYIWLVKKFEDLKNWSGQFQIQKKIKIPKEKKIRFVKKPKEKTKASGAITATDKHYYHLYLKTSTWRKIRKLVLERDSNMCVKCGGNDRLQAHHKTYKNIYDEINHLEDLETLCHDCHEKETERLGQNKKH